MKGVRLQTTGWQVAAATINRVHSSFFDDSPQSPPGTAHLDSALIIRNVASKQAVSGQH